MKLKPKRTKHIKQFDSVIFFFDPEFIRLFLKIFKKLKPYLKIWIPVVIVIIILEFTSLSRKLVFKPLIDIYSENKGLQIENIGLTSELKYWLWVLIGLTVMRGCLRYFRSVASKWVGLRVIRDVRLETYNHVLRLSMKYFDNKRTGDLLARLTGDVNLLRGSVKHLFEEIITKPIEVLLLLSGMLYLSWELTLLTLVVIPFFGGMVYFISAWVKKLSRRIRAKVGDVYSFLVESLSGIQTIKAFDQQNYEYERFDKETWELFKLSMKRTYIRSISNPVLDLILYGSIVVGIIVITLYISHLTAGSVIVFFVLLRDIRGPLKDLTSLQYKMLETLAGAERVFQVMDETVEPDETENPVELTIPEEITFKNVSFAYVKNDWVLRDVSFSVQRGETIAIVGPSGAGKTTLLSLLTRFYDPVEGSIQFNGIDIRQGSLSSLRKLQGLVAQEPFLFADTIMNNVALGRERNDVTFTKALAVAQCNDFVKQLPMAENTLIGERGVTLSGGQRQRLTLARALYDNPPILILDEATSSLDTESERLVQHALEESMRGRTSFVVAHRLSTILNADRILVLDRGSIVEVGSHEQLLSKGGVYAEMYELQFNGKS
jgi:ATP-binding cassette, subfamily B, bacterial MsbA